VIAFDIKLLGGTVECNISDNIDNQPKKSQDAGNNIILNPKYARYDGRESKY